MLYHIAKNINIESDARKNKNRQSFSPISHSHIKFNLWSYGRHTLRSIYLVMVLIQNGLIHTDSIHAPWIVLNSACVIGWHWS